MKRLEFLDAWPRWSKLTVTGVLSAVIILGVLLIKGDAALFLLTLGVVLCALMGYWLGEPACLFVPLVAMGVEVLIGIPATLLQPGGETPISVVLEAPFWTGIPSLIGALAGAGIRSLTDRGARPAEQHM